MASDYRVNTTGALSLQNPFKMFITLYLDGNPLCDSSFEFVACVQFAYSSSLHGQIVHFCISRAAWFWQGHAVWLFVFPWFCLSPPGLPGLFVSQVSFSHSSNILLFFMVACNTPNPYWYSRISEV